MRTEVFPAPDHFLYQDPDIKPPEVWPMMAYSFDFPKKTAKQILSLHGIPFEEGCYALHDPWRQTLTVHNTTAPLEKAGNLLDAFAKEHIDEIVCVYQHRFRICNVREERGWIALGVSGIRRDTRQSSGARASRAPFLASRRIVGAQRKAGETASCLAGSGSPTDEVNDKR